jgi:hypothetical protein
MKKLLAATLAVAAFVAVRHHQRPAPELVLDRVWIDHLPRGEKDPLQIFVALDDGATGLFGHSSVWQGKFERFRFTERSAGKLRLVFPQSGSEELIDVEAKTCNVTGFDMCLEVSGSGHGVNRYYSREDWVIEHLTDASKIVEAL